MISALVRDVSPPEIQVEGCTVVAEKFSMTAEQRQLAVERLMAYPLPFVEYRLMSEGRIPADKISEAISEWRKFMATMLFADGPVGMISPVVDEVWHAHILFTQEYRAFCNIIFGQFIGHAPNWPGAPLSPGSGERFVATYQNIFGVLPAIWTNHRSKVCENYECGNCI